MCFLTKSPAAMIGQEVIGERYGTVAIKCECWRMPHHGMRLNARRWNAGRRLNARRWLNARRRWNTRRWLNIGGQMPAVTDHLLRGNLSSGGKTAQSVDQVVGGDPTLHPVEHCPVGGDGDDRRKRLYTVVPSKFGRAVMIYPYGNERRVNRNNDTGLAEHVTFEFSALWAPACRNVHQHQPSALRGSRSGPLKRTSPIWNSGTNGCCASSQNNQQCQKCLRHGSHYPQYPFCEI